MARQRSDDPRASMEFWGLHSGTRAWVGGHNHEAKAALEPFLNGVQRPPEGPLDIAFIAPLSVDEGLYFAGKLALRLTPAAAVWIVYPRSQTPQAAAYSGTLDDLVLGMFQRGYVEQGTASVSEAFTSRGFRLEGMF